MGTIKSKPIITSDKDFINNYFKPSIEYLKEREHFHKMNTEGITIKKTDNGFIVNFEPGICKCYHEEYGRKVCYGTKEKDECKCNGDRGKCDFY